MLEESNFNCELSIRKYEQAQFVCSELLSDVSNTLKFSTEYLEKSHENEVKLHKKMAKPVIGSFTFIRPEHTSQESMFDLKTEKILEGLSKMISKRIEAVKKSPYYLQ